MNARRRKAAQGSAVPTPEEVARVAADLDCYREADRRGTPVEVIEGLEDATAADLAEGATYRLGEWAAEFAARVANRIEQTKDAAGSWGMDQTITRIKTDMAAGVSFRDAELAELAAYMLNNENTRPRPTWRSRLNNVRGAATKDGVKTERAQAIKDRDVTRAVERLRLQRARR